VMFITFCRFFDASALFTLGGSAQTGARPIAADGGCGKLGILRTGLSIRVDLVSHREARM
jgi:hypothetical protein